MVCFAHNKKCSPFEVDKFGVNGRKQGERSAARDMKLSTKGRYGLKAMVDLATEYDSGARLSIAQLAERQGVSAAYLEQLIASLKKSRACDCAARRSGRVRAARSPELISVGEVLRVLEGSTAIVDCVGTTGTDCSNVCSCSARPLWLKLQRRIDDVLNTTSVRDLADDYITQMERNQDNK